MSKVAFLALTYSSFIKNETMSRFFDPALKDILASILSGNSHIRAEVRPAFN
jgi:hypothetical protein